MNGMKRLTACILTACLSFSLVSCGSIGKPALEKIEEISGELGIDDPVQEVIQLAEDVLPEQRLNPRIRILRLPGQKHRNRNRSP